MREMAVRWLPDSYHTAVPCQDPWHCCGHQISIGLLFNERPTGIQLHPVATELHDL